MRLKAEVEFRFEAPDAREGAHRLRALAEAAEAAGFEYRRAAVREDDEPDDDGGWTGYAPLSP